MPIATLTTDFGTQDFYAGALKGALLTRVPHLRVVDISHHIPAHDIVQAAFVLRNAYPFFPKDTIHIVSINNYYHKHYEHIAIRRDGHYFLAPNNGVLSLVFEAELAEAHLLTAYPKRNFSIENTFAAAVKYLVSGRPVAQIGSPVNQIVQKILLQPIITRTHIKGTVIHIDHYGNVVVNIRQQLFESARRNRTFAIYFKRYDALTQISTNYYDVPPGETLCLFNSAGYLEIAINMGRANTLLGLSIEDNVQIDFDEDP